MGNDTIFWLICAAAAVIMIIYYSKCRRKLAAFLFGALTGLAALILLNKYGSYFETPMPLNIFNVCGSVILGVPFVICLVILNFL